MVVDENQQIEYCGIIFYSALLQDSVEVLKYFNPFCVVRNTNMTASTSEVFWSGGTVYNVSHLTAVFDWHLISICISEINVILK